MSVVLINPNLLAQENDTFTTGIVYMPIGLAYLAAALRSQGFPVRVVDAFGDNPSQVRKEGKFLVFGLDYAEVVARVPADATLALLYANQLANAQSLLGILRALKHERPDLPAVIVENTQAVTAFALRPVAPLFFAAGADYVLTGEAEESAVQLARALNCGLRNVDCGLKDHFFHPQSTFRNPQSAVPGLCGPGFSNPAGKRPDLDELPLPAWDLFPLQKYWGLRFAHGPLSTGRYLPLLTSRGCPYPCKFCVVPATNGQRWRARSPANVVAEMEHHLRTFGVTEFHIEDLDPTIDDRRTRALCRLLIERRLPVQWKIVAGTKVETMRSEETIDLMARAGCRYISISPESGSPRVLKLMAKPFNIDHAVRLIKRMNQVGIRSQACFVLGFPGETDEDRELTRRMVHDLTRNGVDEIALFIISPVPGSAIFEQFQGYRSLSELNFTPTWRADYPELSRFRRGLYARFLLWKARYHPGKILRQVGNFLGRRFETKMEMVPYRSLVFRWRGLFARRAEGGESVGAGQAEGGGGDGLRAAA